MKKEISVLGNSKKDEEMEKEYYIIIAMIIIKEIDMKGNGKMA